VVTFTDGYAAGGWTTTNLDTVDKFPLTAPFVTASDVGNLTAAFQLGAGTQSSTEGFVVGGTPAFYRRSVDSFPFAAPFATASDAGDLRVDIVNTTAVSDGTYGYVLGGRFGPASPLKFTAEIQRFPFSAPFATTTDVGNIAAAGIAYQTSAQSSTDGYRMGGGTDGTATGIQDDITRFPFSTPFVTASNIGTISENRREGAGVQSDTHGYSGGGVSNSGSSYVETDSIDSFPFASPFATATVVGDLIVARRPYKDGAQGDSDGFFFGGVNFGDFRTAPLQNTNVVQSFPFAAPFANATDVGDLTASKRRGAGLTGQ
jgi:hypothetical protein